MKIQKARVGFNTPVTQSNKYSLSNYKMWQTWWRMDTPKMSILQRKKEGGGKSYRGTAQRAKVLLELEMFGFRYVGSLSKSLIQTLWPLVTSQI